MPTVLSPQNDSSAEGPKVVLPADSTTESTTPNQPPVAAANPLQAPVVSTPKTTPAPVAPTAASSSEQAHKRLQEQEAELAKQLDALTTQERGWLEKIKNLVSQTESAEQDESKLQEQLLIVQNARQELLNNPDKAADILKSAEQAMSMPAHEPPTEHVEPAVEVTASKPAETPAEQPAPEVTPTPAPAPAKSADEIMAALTEHYAAGNAMIAEHVVAGAMLYVTPDNGVLVEHDGHSIYFTPEDVLAAQLADTDMVGLPQKTTTHLPPPAVNQNTTAAAPAVQVEAPMQAPAQPAVEPAPAPVAQPEIAPAPATPEPVQEVAAVQPVVEPPSEDPTGPIDIMQAINKMAASKEAPAKETPTPVAPATPEAAPAVETPAPVANAPLQPTTEPQPIPPANPAAAQPMAEAPVQMPADPNAAAPASDIHSKLKQLANQETVQKVQDSSQLFNSPDGNGIMMMNGEEVTHISDAELIQANITGIDIAQLPAAPDGMAPGGAPGAEPGIPAMGTGGPSPLQPFPQMPTAAPVQQMPQQAPAQPAAQAPMQQQAMQPGMQQAPQQMPQQQMPGQPQQMPQQPMQPQVPQQ